MAVLNVRNLPDEVRSRLRIRAAKAGRSMEAEARAILTAVCTADKVAKTDLQSWVGNLYGNKKPSKVFEALLTERRKESAKE